MESPDDSYIVGFAKVLMCFTFLIRLAFWWRGNLKIPMAYGGKPKFNRKLDCIVFSHGLGGNRFFYSNICCELASRGFLVVALEHRDYSASNTYYYKSQEDAQTDIRAILKHRPITLGKSHYTERNAQVNYRANECCRALDFLIELNDNVNIPYNVISDVPSRYKVDCELSDFVGQLNLDTVTMAGHSFGGATALLALAKRKEFKQGVVLDPWMFPVKDEKLNEKVHQPLLFINTQTFHITSNVDAMAKLISGENREMYTLLHTTHENQTDTVFLVGYWLNWFMKKLEPLTAITINNYIIFKFLNQYVGLPTNIEDCRKFLETQEENFKVGLTKPWA